VAVLALVVSAALSGCAADSTGGGGKADAKGSKQIIAIFYTKTLEFYTTMYNGISDEAKERGYTVSARYANFDLNDEQEMFRNAITKRPAAIILAPMQADAWAPVLQEAKAAGVPVIIVANDVPKESQSLRLSLVGVGNYDVGKAKAEWLVKELNGQGQVVVIHFLRGHPYTEEQRRAYKDVFGKQPGIEVVEGPYATSSEEGIAATENALSAHAHPDAIYFDGDDGAIGGIQALKERGLTDAITASSDGTVAAVKAVKEGRLDLTVSMRPYKTGQDALTAVADYLDDGTKPANVIDFPPLMITADNVDDVPPAELGQDR
jgi:ribose transport system substrate-binding protein